MYSVQLPRVAGQSRGVSAKGGRRVGRLGKHAGRCSVLPAGGWRGLCFCRRRFGLNRADVLVLSAFVAINFVAFCLCSCVAGCGLPVAGVQRPAAALHALAGVWRGGALAIAPYRVAIVLG